MTTIAKPAAISGDIRRNKESTIGDERNGLQDTLLGTGSGAAWLAHLLWEQGVAGSNPAFPTSAFGPSDSRLAESRP